MLSFVSRFDDVRQKRLLPRGRRQGLPWRWLMGMSAIVLVTAIWGYSNVVMRQGEAAISPTVLMWLRFGIGGLLMLPTLFRIRMVRRDWLIGLFTGALLGGSVLAQCLAMTTIPVDEVAFITALYVVFTPLAAGLLERVLPSWRVWVSIVFSFVGVALLIGKLTLHLDVGVLWSLAAAIGLSGQIIGTNLLANRLSSVQLASVQSAGAGLTMTIAVLIQGVLQPSIYNGLFQWTFMEWYRILFLAILATVVAVFLQAWGQARISATDAALAFNMEPVWTVVFAWAILAQGMSPAQAVGAALIVGSLTIVSQPKQMM